MRQDRYRRDCNERGDETIFDRGRGSLVAQEILAFGSNVHSFVSCALPTLRGRLPPLHFPLWTENSNLSLTAAWKSSLVRQVPIATVNETLASLQFRVSRRTAASISPYRFNHELNCERAAYADAFALDSRRSGSGRSAPTCNYIKISLCGYAAWKSWRE